MKTITLSLVLALAATSVGCSNDEQIDLGTGSGPGVESPNDPNNRETSKDPANTGASNDHMNGPTGDPNGGTSDNTAQKIENETKVGGANVVARLHACGKMQNATLGKYLLSRGVPQASKGYQAFMNGIQSLGAPSYGARVPEAPFPSVSAHSKMFDIAVMVAPDVIANMKTSTACPAVELLAADGKSFTKDGISCITGTPATDTHVEVSRLAIADNATDGAKLAVAALIQSTIVCE
jgi:hypothetical protein